MYQVGGFYQMYYNDAQTASDILMIKMTQRSIGGGVRVPMCGIPHRSWEKYAEKLTGCGYRVIICSQTGDADGSVVRTITHVQEPDMPKIDLTKEWDTYLENYHFEPDDLKLKTTRKSNISERDSLMFELAALELDNITPIDALRVLYGWKKKYL